MIPHLSDKGYKYLNAYNPNVGFLFPGRDNTEPLTRAQADVIFKEPCKKVRIKGASRERGTFGMSINTREPHHDFFTAQPIISIIGDNYHLFPLNI